MLSYKPLLKTLIDKNIKTSDLVKDEVISSSTLTKILNDKHVSLNTINSICKYLNCKIEDVISFEMLN